MARCTGARAGGRGNAREDDRAWGALGVRGGELVLGAWPPGRAGGWTPGGSLGRRDLGRVGGLNWCTWEHGVTLYSLNIEYPVPGTVLEAETTA